MEVELADQQAGRQALAGAPQALQVVARGDRLMITVHDRERDWPPLEAALRAAGLADLQMRPAAPSLEDVFVQVMARDCR